MNYPRIAERDPAPPHVGMNDYLSFVEGVIAITRPEHIRRQKEIEEQIVERFRFPEEDGRPQTEDK